MLKPFSFFRPLWHYYFENNDAVIYVIDSSDRERFDEAKEELWDLIQDDRLRDSSLLVLANKQVFFITKHNLISSSSSKNSEICSFSNTSIPKDMPRAASASEITNALDLTKMTQRQWFVQVTCATSGEGLVEGLEWLAQRVKEKKKTQKQGVSF